MIERRSIQDIIPPARSKPIRAPLQKSADTPPPPTPTEPPRSPLPPQRSHSSNSFPLLIGVALVVILIIGAGFGVVSTVFHRATVTVELNSFTVTVAETFEASPDGDLLSFTTRETQGEATTNIPQTGSTAVEERATGTVVIYNEYSTGNQRLITNTRFETPEGLIYRIKSPVVVPGYTTKDGKKVAGNIEAVVYADEAGDSYNSAATSFTIPGLKGTSQFETMYARSKGSLTGGFVGNRAVVEKTVRDAAIAELKIEAEREAREKMEQSTTPADILLAGTVTVEFVELPDVAGEGSATIGVRAVARAPFFSQAQLAKVIANEGGVTYGGELMIKNSDQLALVVKPSETKGNMSVTISGDVYMVGVYDQARLIQDLSGKDRRTIGLVLSEYPAIADMKVSVYPLWRGTVPESVEKIKVVEEVPETSTP